MRVEAIVGELVPKLRSEFINAADAKPAQSSAAYMRGRFAFYGIPAPVQQRIARDVTEGLPTPTEAVLRRVATTCWSQPEREWQYFACGYLRKHIEVAPAAFIVTVRQLITTKSWWDTVDSLATRTVGPLVRAHPQLAMTMDDWIGSDDIWLARTALLHQLTYKRDTDVDRLFGYCLRRAADREFFIRKAIGWALREYTKSDDKAVRRFLREYGDELSPLSRAEAMKWLVRRATSLH